MDKSIHANSYYLKDTIFFFLLQKHISHTSGELHDLEMSEEEIIEVGIIFSVHAIIILIINTIIPLC